MPIRTISGAAAIALMALPTAADARPYGRPTTPGPPRS
jgi:hypothetical protein